MLLALALLAHPLSVSSTRIAVDGARVEALMRVQDLTLLETLPIDGDSDGRLSRDELERARGAIERYALAGWKLSATFANSPDEPLSGHLVSAALSDGVVTQARGNERLVDLVWRFDAARELAGLRVDFALFRESDPLHRDHAQIVWNGAEPSARVLWVEDPVWNFTPAGASSKSPFAAFVRLGIEHIGFGWDHIAFVVALIVGARALRSVALTATAFTLAHSITLALAAFELVRAPASIVEPVIAASIVWVAARNVISRTARTPWLEAFLFGLVHGLGFAGSIADTLAAESQKLAALVGFNLGVEIGQLAIIAVLGGALAWLGRSRANAKVPGAGLAPREIRVAASIVVGVLGLYWFAERAFGS